MIYRTLFTSFRKGKALIVLHVRRCTFCVRISIFLHQKHVHFDLSSDILTFPDNLNYHCTTMMMQANILQRSGNYATLSKKAIIGDVTQVRNHVKMWPWRRNRNNRECYLDNTKTPYTDRHNPNEFDKDKRQKKLWMQVIPKDKDNRYNAYKWNLNYRSDPVEAKETAESKLKRFQDSLKDRGSAREAKSYDPPEGVQERILTLCKASMLNSDVLTSPSDEDILNMDLNQSMKLKYNIITKCIEVFQHELPTSWLNDVGTINDLVNYYSTPVRGVNPYSAMFNKQNSLPNNLCLVPEPIRYDKENDQFFKGYNALPGIISRVPGLRGSKKYPVLNQDEFQWPDI